MDVGYYISELLGQHGDVNVPGLGYFAHTRVNGYYNDREGKFYPPGYSVQFDPQFLDDDDALAIHIAEKKKISLASSKYFTEKFVMNLKQQAALGDAALADLGWFTLNNLQMVFRPNNGTSTAPEFYGYPIIKLHKIGKQPVAVKDEPEPEPETYTPEPGDGQYAPIPYQIDETEEQFLIKMARNKRRTNIWVIIILTLIAAAIAVLMVQRYNPKVFNFKFGKKKEAPTVAPQIIVLGDTGKTKPDTDSIKLIRPATSDSLKKNIAPLTDTTAISRYEVIAGSFRDVAEAGEAIRRFKAKGIDAKVVTDMFGKRLKVSVGTFINKNMAEERRMQLVAEKKIPEDSYSQLIDPKHKGVDQSKK
ncbi:HU domain-containing protein [Mucilaginibacter psychrotolerans]|uniref:SPOR domain-containing protein n=1 Tax=Mucilaginibacter psychrotolerans TaxID=1524096 RepID=A0A4Y8S972_9SPHI|nr:SPOR domain-containing protein [Mucilaginibacter psychrotolerans]TFF35077.1 SPOR domain-containing protein [Mucilaginibacter psychrotolerans]